jgi:hypothetical protein
MLNLAVADVLTAYAIAGGALATLVVLAAPHLEMFARFILYGKG